jgi:hypothetical protein
MDGWEKFMKHSVEMDAGVVMYMPSFIKIHSGILKSMGAGGIHRLRQNMVIL